MTDLAIQVEGLGKRYRIGHLKNTSDKHATSLLQIMQRPMRALTGKHSEGDPSDTFWALRDLSFDVKQGEVLGIIGRNGAGKSTLLKILTEITNPTTGSIEIWGRIASLLEVGTGFHPELTGRENVYLNGAILGMRKAEIARKFDEIVSFAEIDRFIDTPVKRYSSGMYTRLAFAVAAHMEPEILIVDEVLAVGDVQFQQKCLSKMSEVAHQGRTVLFVSHNTAAVTTLCTAAMMLENGKMTCQGTADEVVTQYLQSVARVREKGDEGIGFFRPTWAKPTIDSVRLLNHEGDEETVFPMGSDIVVEMTFHVSNGEGLRTPVMGVILNHSTLGTVGGVSTRMTHYQAEEGPFPAATFRCTLHHLPFLRGQYTADVWLGDGLVDLDTLTGYLSFDIEEADVYGTGHAPFSYPGMAFLDPTWDLIPEP